MVLPMHRRPGTHDGTRSNRMKTVTFLCRRESFRSGVGLNGCNIAISLVDQRSKRVIAFHEKAGRSQVGSSVFWFDKVVFPPSRHCRHPSIRTH
jgi:hypothetical protein